MKISLVLPHFKQHLPGGYQVLLQYAALWAQHHQVELILPYKAHAVRAPGFKSLAIYCAKQIKRSLQALIPTWTQAWKSHPGLKNLPSIQISTPFSLRSHTWSPTDLILCSWWEDADFLIHLKHPAQKVLFCQGYESWSAPTLLLKRCYEHPQLHLVTISTWLAEQLKIHHHRDCPVVLNAIDPQHFYPSSSDPIYDLGVVLRLSEPWKGGDLALDLARQNPHLRFLATSFSPIDPQRIPPNMTLRLGNQTEHMRQFYHDIGFLLNTSLSEGFGLTLAEAMLCQRCVISTPVGAVKDLVQAGQNGWISEDFSLDSLQRALQVALSIDPLRLDQARQSARAQVCQYHPQTQAMKLLHILEELLNAKS